MATVSTYQTVVTLANSLGVELNSSNQLSSAKSVSGSVDNLVAQSSNITVSKGRIGDTDFSVEMAKLVKAQIFSEAASQVLSRANGSGQNAMRLLS